MSSQESMFCVEGFHASPTASPGSRVAMEMTAISSQRCYDLLKLSGLDGSLLKMYGALFRCRWASTAVYLKWKILVTESKHFLPVLSVSMPAIEGNDAGLWATASKQWPTPKSSISGPDYDRMNRKESGGDDLVTAVARSSRIWPTTLAGGSLNPQWVEWLMGFPIGWTDCDVSETPSSAKSSPTSDEQS